MRYSADFGNTILGGLGDDSSTQLDTPTGVAAGSSDGGTNAPATPTAQPTAQPAAAADPSGGLCTQSTCGGMAAAATAALGALGPKQSPVPAATVTALCADKSVAGQAQCSAVTQQNATINAQNSQRAAIISQFVKDAVGPNVTPQQMQLGDASLAQYALLKQKYGPQIGSLTLTQLVAQYPDDAQAIVTSLGQVFPALKGKTFSQIWALIPQTFKDMNLDDLEHAIPNSSWGKPSVIPGVSNTTAEIGGGAIILLGLLAYFAFRKKKGSQ